MARLLSALCAASLAAWAPAALADDAPADLYASTSAQCRALFTGADRGSCATCVTKAGHHFYKATGADRCRVDDQAANKNLVDKAGDKIGGAANDAAHAAGRAGAATGRWLEKAGNKIGGAADKPAEQTEKATETPAEKPVDK